MTADVDTLSHVLERIERAPVIDAPFAHIVIEELLPPELYQELLAAIPSTASMDRVSYPGSGYGQRGPHYKPYGYAHPDLGAAEGALAAVRDVFASEMFARALLGKFEEAIPAEKRRFFDGANDFTTVFDLQVDLPGYAIAPHPDTPSKIVTFQLYLSADETLGEHGTMLCAPKDERSLRGRSTPARAGGRVVDLVTRVSPRARRRVERSRLGEVLGVGGQRLWFPWSWFDVVKVAPALPNYFLAFAPGERSFHAVNMDGLTGQRPVLRGFIRSGSSTNNWIGPYSR